MTNSKKNDPAIGGGSCRRQRFHHSSLRSMLCWLLLASVPLLTSCPKRPPREPGKPPHRRPPLTYPDEVHTPERKAAGELIEQGKRALAEGDLENADWHLQEAIRLDPSYGPAYYWLARTKYELDEHRQAWDLLDRAELLIGHDAVWLERIDQLRQALSQ